MRISASDTT